MSRRLIIGAEAEADLSEAAVWYEGREGGLGLELADEGAAIQRAVERPLSYWLLPGSPPLPVSHLLHRARRRHPVSRRIGRKKNS